VIRIIHLLAAGCASAILIIFCNKKEFSILIEIKKNKKPK
jgi:hypothetical protein